MMFNIPLLTQITNYTYYTHYITICQPAELVQLNINYTLSSNIQYQYTLSTVVPLPHSIFINETEYFQNITEDENDALDELL